MFVSMTGYGFGAIETANARFEVEIKSVNHRFCDVLVKSPKEYMALEPHIVAQVKTVYRRGRIEVNVRRVDQGATGKKIKIDVGLAQLYYEQLSELKRSLGLSDDVALAHLLAQDGVVTSEETTRAPESDWPFISEALENALAAALEMRRKEGENLLRDVAERLDLLKLEHQVIVELSSTVREEIEQRLDRRVREALARVDGGEIDHGRMLQEVVYLIDRADVSEEITRLSSHLEQFTDLLKEEDVVGKRIEFLLQEMVRETNTIGSKSGNSEVVRRGMTIKVELEKIREQIQNVE